MSGSDGIYGSVHVVLSAIFPSGSGYKQTLEGRRKRFKQALIALLEKGGWLHLGRCRFAQEVYAEKPRRLPATSI